MATPDLPQGHVPDDSDDSNASSPRVLERSRLEEMLVKGSIWKKQTLRDIESKRELAATESNERNTKTARSIFRLSAQLDERNDEIERMRRAISKLENEKSDLDRVHRLALELHQGEMESLQEAYNQFEKESDDLLSELSQQNESLRASKEVELTARPTPHSS
jgi:hypothetical protein